MRCSTSHATAAFGGTSRATGASARVCAPESPAGARVPPGAQVRRRHRRRGRGQRLGGGQALRGSRRRNLRRSESLRERDYPPALDRHARYAPPVAKPTACSPRAGGSSPRPRGASSRCWSRMRQNPPSAADDPPAPPDVSKHSANDVADCRGLRPGRAPARGKYRCVARFVVVFLLVSRRWVGARPLAPRTGAIPCAGSRPACRTAARIPPGSLPSRVGPIDRAALSIHSCNAAAHSVVCSSLGLNAFASRWIG